MACDTFIKHVGFVFEFWNTFKAYTFRHDTFIDTTQHVCHPYVGGVHNEELRTYIFSSFITQYDH